MDATLYYQSVLLILVSIQMCDQVTSRNADLLQMQFTRRDQKGKENCRYTCDNSRQRPVCASDGRTYASMCELQRARLCEGKRTDLVSRGKCKGSTGSRCLEERRKAQELHRLQPNSYPLIPRCKPGGAYEEVQCHDQTGYCWCVTEDGKPIRSTGRRGKTLQCSGRNVRRGSGIGKRGVQTKGCSAAERSKFNLNLIKLFSEEFARIPKPTTETSISHASDAERSPDSSVLSTDKRVIEWKFTQLDTDNDQVLKKKEVRSLRRMVKKLVRPKICARSFVSHCDVDKNKKISRSEWSNCLVVDFRRQQTRPTQNVPTSGPKDRVLGLSPRPESWERSVLRPSNPNKGKKDRQDTNEKKDCAAERAMAIKMDHKDPSSKIFIPECNSEGKYKRTQCHKSTGYCWCVKQVTGTPIPGTVTHNETPECDNVLFRDMKDCPYSTRRAFLKELIQTFSAQMAKQATNTTETSSLSTSEHSKDERVVRWKFSALDTSKNTLIDRREKRQLKKDLRNIKPKRKKKAVRKCTREFVSFCDANNDKSITLTEWINCMILHGKSQPPKVLPTPRNRKGPNPFEHILTSSP